SAAIDRERYGRGGGGGGGGINRYPDVSGRTGQPGRSGGGRQESGYARQDAGYSRPQGERHDRPAPRRGDPWSAAPPEPEDLRRAPTRKTAPSSDAQATSVEAAGADATAPEAAAPKRRAPGKKAEPA